MYTATVMQKYWIPLIHVRFFNYFEKSDAIVTDAKSHLRKIISLQKIHKLLNKVYSRRKLDDSKE